MPGNFILSLKQFFLTLKTGSQSDMGVFEVNDDNSEYTVKMNIDVFRKLLMKTVILVIFILLPILILLFGQYTLEACIGVVDPGNPSWIAVAVIVLIWYIIVFVFAVPHAGRYIDNKHLR